MVKSGADRVKAPVTAIGELTFKPRHWLFLLPEPRLNFVVPTSGIGCSAKARICHQAIDIASFCTAGAA